MDNNTPEMNCACAETQEDQRKEKKRRSKKTPPKMSDLMKKMNRTLKIQTAWLIILSILVVGLAGCIFSDVLIYNAAKIYINSGDIERGVSLLNRIPDYSQTAELLDQYKYTVKGNVIKLGSYEQDGDNGNGSEALEWIVLDYDAEAKKALIMTKYAIDAVIYKDGYGAVTWETSDARKWLNRDFLRKAFKGEDLGMILETDIETPNNIKYDTNGGNITADKVFLLSDKEFNKYLKNTENAIGYTTQYARDNGVQSGPISGTSVCWLRSPGESLVYVSTVSYVGELNSMGVYSYSYSCGVRPVMWISTGE